MSKRIRHPPNDLAGRDVRVGDWVRVVSVPESIARMPRETKQAFSRAVGKTFQIEAFDESGCAELDLTGKVGRDTIWIEPVCVRRVRRPGRHSRRFRSVLKLRRKLDRPRWSLPYVATYHARDNPQRLVGRLVDRLQPDWISSGWVVLEQQREIHGTFYAPDRRVSSKQRLERLKKALTDSNLFRSLHFGRIRQRG